MQQVHNDNLDQHFKLLHKILNQRKILLILSKKVLI